MNIEITDLDMILNYLETTNLEPHDDYTSEITYKDQKILYKYIKELQQENQQLKLINKEYERLNKENGRGFKITSVKQYNIDKLIKYEDNWNKLKEYINKMHEYFLYTDVNEIYKQSMKLDNQFPNLFNLSELNASDRILSSICKKMQEIEEMS